MTAGRASAVKPATSSAFESRLPSPAKPGPHGSDVSRPHVGVLAGCVSRSLRRQIGADVMEDAIPGPGMISLFTGEPTGLQIDLSVRRLPDEVTMTQLLDSGPWRIILEDPLPGAVDPGDQQPHLLLLPKRVGRRPHRLNHGGHVADGLTVVDEHGDALPKYLQAHVRPPILPHPAIRSPVPGSADTHGSLRLPAVPASRGTTRRATGSRSRSPLTTPSRVKALVPRRSCCRCARVGQVACLCAATHVDSQSNNSGAATMIIPR